VRQQQAQQRQLLVAERLHHLAHVAGLHHGARRQCRRHFFGVLGSGIRVFEGRKNEGDDVRRASA